MRKICILTVLMAALVLDGYAQGKRKIGITGGIANVSSTIADFQRVGANGEKFEYAYSSLLSYSGGLVFNFPVGKSMSIRPELLYTQKGATIKANDETDNWENEINMNYIELPLNILFNAPGKNGKFMIGGGPYAAYAIDGVVKFGNDDSEREILFDGSPGGFTANNFDYGINLMAGYQFKGGFFFNLRYAQGLNDIFLEDGKNKHTLIGLNIGFMF